MLSGLYAGFIPNFLRQMSKYFYRFPMMIYFPKKIEEHMPKKYLNKYEGLHKVKYKLYIIKNYTNNFNYSVKL